jgi:hypothetical protein
MAFCFGVNQTIVSLQPHESMQADGGHASGICVELDVVPDCETRATRQVPKIALSITLQVHYTLIFEQEMKA